MNMKYAALNGIVINIGETSRYGCPVSVQLMVELADTLSGRPGLFSQEDINTALRLSPHFGSLFNSLLSLL